MCYFIIISFSREHAEIIKDKYPLDLHIFELSNQYVQNYLPNNYISYAVTAGGCSCDLFIEESTINEVNKRLDQLRKKYKRKGWSAAKIKRSITQVQFSADSSPAKGLRGDVKNYILDILTDVDEMRILVHWYEEDIHSEKISGIKTVMISRDEFCKRNPIRRTDLLFVLGYRHRVNNFQPQVKG